MILHITILVPILLFLKQCYCLYFLLVGIPHIHFIKMMNCSFVGFAFITITIACRIVFTLCCIVSIDYFVAFCYVYVFGFYFFVVCCLLCYVCTQKSVICNIQVYCILQRHKNGF